MYCKITAYDRTGWTASASSKYFFSYIRGLIIVAIYIYNATAWDGSNTPQRMIDNDLTDSYWWSNGDYDWIEIDMEVSQRVGRVFVNFGWWYNNGFGCPYGCTNTKYVH